eukprot:gnl/TRDRNA2_/TRDRNA2_198925_c0_seq1.p1 gnl/TRDRNA2_/TRDRNA2_198925_c0~~gnl/TRDRNA2_/TRDRNA2_198925_c0_seq1.p1  ORF type:complete len:363 (+),score=32.46 gnl/TRDRNA2_/TRDRNA2_198925_c0_seq1:262-1350(+)
MLQHQLASSDAKTCLAACRSAAGLPLGTLKNVAPYLEYVADHRGPEIRKAARVALAKLPAEERRGLAAREPQPPKEREPRPLLSRERKAEPGKATKGPQYEDSYLQRVEDTRIGDGRALTRAMADQQTAKAVVWFTVPCGNGAESSWFAQHSLLKITVGDGETGSEYMLEKTGTLEDPNNGVCISEWPSSLHQAEVWSSLRGHEIAEELTIAQLYSTALEMGPYDLLNNNCHHTAQKIFNICARAQNRQDRIPNQFLIALGKVSRNTFGGFASRSVSANASSQHETSGSVSVNPISHSASANTISHSASANTEASRSASASANTEASPSASATAISRHEHSACASVSVNPSSEQSEEQVYSL